MKIQITKIGNNDGVVPVRDLRLNRSQKVVKKMGSVCLILLLFSLVGLKILDNHLVNAYDVVLKTASEQEHTRYIARFPDVKTVIGCYNDISKTTREATRCTGRGDHNITLPTKDDIKIWLKYYNEWEITNRLALINFESNFDINASNPYAKGYVQTLRSYNIAIDIDSQLKWLKRRQDSQSLVVNGKSKRCGYYWTHDNLTDGFKAGEYGVLSCLYRYHYHAYKGTWYAKRGILTTKFYKKYMFGI